MSETTQFESDPSPDLSVLVVGSYPPVPVPAASVTLGVVQRAWDEGLEATVVSPRLSAAHYAVQVRGLWAGWRLARLRGATGCRQVVLCVEPQIPFSPTGHLNWLTARLLARAMKGFERAKLVVAVDPGPAATRALDVLGRSGVQVIWDLQTGEPPTGVTALGPHEVLLRDRLRHGLRLVLGRVVRPLRRRR